MTRLRCQLHCYFVLSPLWDVQIYDVITTGLEEEQIYSAYKRILPGSLCLLLLFLIYNGDNTRGQGLTENISRPRGSRFIQ